MTEPTPPGERDLLPCPFCGDTKTLRFEVDQNQGTKWGCVVCGCGVFGPDVRTQYKETGWEPEAAKEWNTRAPAQAIREAENAAYERAAQIAESDQITGDAPTELSEREIKCVVASFRATKDSIAKAIREMKP